MCYPGWARALSTELLLGWVSLVTCPDRDVSRSDWSVEEHVVFAACLFSLIAFSFLVVSLLFEHPSGVKYLNSKKLKELALGRFLLQYFIWYIQRTLSLHVFKEFAHLGFPAGTAISMRSLHFALLMLLHKLLGLFLLLAQILIYLLAIKTGLSCKYFPSNICTVQVILFSQLPMEAKIQAGKGWKTEGLSPPAGCRKNVSVLTPL